MPFSSVAAAVMLALSCSLDAFVASFAYGSNRIKIPLMSNHIINLICTCMLGFSLLVGSVVRDYIPDGVTVWVSFIVLFILGITKLLDCFTKSIIRKYDVIDKEIKFSMFNLKFILRLYADPEAADVDASKTISPSEAAALAVSLSLDGIAIGFGAALGSINILAVLITTLIVNMAAVTLGCYLGNKIARRAPFNLSWISGVILIALAVARIV